MTLYRAVSLLEPAPGGCQVTELIILGTDFTVPFFLRGIARRGSLKLFQDRVHALWTRARWRAEGVDPLQSPR